jgi:opacity protein-like surface antigen
MDKTRVLCTGVVALLSGAVDAADHGFYVGLDAGLSQAELGRDRSGVQLASVRPDTSSKDQSDTALGVHVGYEFSKHLAVELGYADAGEVRYSTNDTDFLTYPAGATPNFDTSLSGNPAAFVQGQFVAYPFGVVQPPVHTETTIATKLLSLSARGRCEFWNSIGLFGVLGVSDQRTQAHQAITSAVFGPFSRGEHGHHTGWDLAVGADWAFHPNWSWRIQYERHMGAEEKTFDDVERGDLEIVSTGLSYRF